MENGHPGEVTPFPITASASASEIAQRLAATAFQGRNPGQATAIWEAMLPLANLRIYRFYDTLAPEHEFSIGERFVTEFSLALDEGRPYSTREYFHLLGKALTPLAKQEGILTAAARHGVPIYCPAFGDSVHGLAAAEGRVRTGKRVMFDIIGDVLETAHIALTANKTGVVYVGGGTPKNFIQQAGGAAYLFQRGRPGRTYGIQVTTDEPQRGGPPGRTPA